MDDDRGGEESCTPVDPLISMISQRQSSRLWSSAGSCHVLASPEECIATHSLVGMRIDAEHISLTGDDHGELWTQNHASDSKSWSVANFFFQSLSFLKVLFATEVSTPQPTANEALGGKTTVS